MNQYIDQLLPAFCSILGFHSSMLKYDYMHCMYLGVMAIVIGNILQELVKERAFGQFEGPKTVTDVLQLRDAWRLFKAFCKTNKITSSQEVFTPARIGMGEWPCFKGKAANTQKVAWWLHQFLRSRMGSHSTLREQVRYNVLHGWCRCDEIMRSSTDPLWFTQDEAAMFASMSELSVLSFEILSREAHENHQRKWPFKPTHHAIDEVASDVQRTLRNPRSVWGFKHEDFIGHLKKLGMRCHISTACATVLSRWKLRLTFPTYQTTSVRPRQ